MTATRLYLVRHAHAHWSPDEARPLSAEGARAAARLAEIFDGRAVHAVYSSPSQRAIETVSVIARRRGLTPIIIEDLRERDLRPVPSEDFVEAARETWRQPHATPFGGEANAVAQARGLAVLRRLLTGHGGVDVVVSTHGTLMALMMNGLDPAYGFQFWQRLTFPDVFCLTVVAGRMIAVDRIWTDD